MSIQKSNARHDLCRLIEDLWENRLDEHGTAELAKLLDDSPDFRQMYVEAVHLHASLISWSMAGRDRALLGTTIADEQGSEGPAGNTNEESHSTRRCGFDEQSSNLAEASAVLRPSRFLLNHAREMLAAAILMALCSAWWIGRWQSDQVAVVGPPANLVDPSAAEEASEDDQQSTGFVAQITGLSDDILWSDASTASDFLLRVRTGERIGLSLGVAELEFAAGAKVVLHGPAEFEVTGSESGRLLSGHLTGHAENGNFLLTTPSANVIDLGTDFGVAVDHDSNTDVVVFDGDVRVASALGDNWEPKSMHLKTGMGVRVAADGSIVPSNKLDANDFSTAQQHTDFDESKGEVSLIDILNSNDRETTGRPRPVGTIDPITGRSFPQPWLERFGPGVRMGNGLYHVTNWHPFVDGIFVPTPDGTDTQIDSTGHCVRVPANCSRTWGPIWSRRTIGAPMAKFENCDFWGNYTLPVLQQRFASCRLGMVGLHANVGISIKLWAIREAYDTEIKGISATVANLDNSKEHDLAEGYGVRERPRFSADIRAYVDGKLVYSRLDFARADGESEMQIPLNAESHILTIVSTDAMHHSLGNAYDHVVLIDPVVHCAK